MRGRHALPASRARRAGFVSLVGILLASTAALAVWRFGPEEPTPSPVPRGAAPAPPPPVPSPIPAPSQPAPSQGPINTAVEGLTTFRGNATRTYHGEGPVPRRPRIAWRYPASGGLCGDSTAGGETKTWCGTGWTGQPNVVETDGRTEVRFGAYDYGVHVLDAETGAPAYAPFRTGDLIKGTVTSDPDAFPLIYTGSRDDRFRILATDRGDALEELWALDASSAPEPIWNNDWDGSALVIDDHLLEGGENSWFYVVKLNRGYDAEGRVRVRPKIRAMVPGYDEELFAELGDRQVSIESSVAYHDGVAYFANSGGLVQGWDVSRVLRGGTRMKRVFRFWMGDDVDATIVIDDEGFLYVAAELERFNQRAAEIGQLVKLDPRATGDPLVWSLEVPGEGGDGGIWATPAIHGATLYVPTNTGRLLAVHRGTGRIRWEIRLPGPTWSSPAVVDDVLVVGDCAGDLHAYDVSNPRREPPELWRLSLGGCIESTPAIWRGGIYVGTRAGAVYGIR